MSSRSHDRSERRCGYLDGDGIGMILANWMDKVWFVRTTQDSSV